VVLHAERRLRLLERRLTAARGLRPGVPGALPRSDGATGSSRAGPSEPAPGPLSVAEIARQHMDRLRPAERKVARTLLGGLSQRRAEYGGRPGPAGGRQRPDRRALRTGSRVRRVSRAAGGAASGADPTLERAAGKHAPRVRAGHSDRAPAAARRQRAAADPRELRRDPALGHRVNGGAAGRYVPAAVHRGRTVQPRASGVSGAAARAAPPAGALPHRPVRC